MAGEYDDRFVEITGLLQKMQKSIGGVDELRLEMRDMRSDVRDIRNELRETNSRMGSFEAKVDVLSGQFNDVGVMAIKDHKRIDSLEERVDVLEAEVR